MIFPFSKAPVDQLPVDQLAVGCGPGPQNVPWTFLGTSAEAFPNAYRGCVYRARHGEHDGFGM